MRLILISDTHLAPEAHAFNRNAEAAVEAMAALEPDLVLHLGDVTADGVKDHAQFAFARDVLAAVPGPFRLVPGNHDVGDGPPTGGVREPLFDPAARAAFTDAFGSDRWSLREDGWLLIGLNAHLFGTGSPGEAAQVDWLSAVLAEGNEPVALFVHKPLFLHQPDDHPGHGRYLLLPARAKLLDQLARRDVRLIASGHVHQARSAIHGRALHLWAPSTAFTFPDSMQETFGRKQVGFCLVELGPDGVETQVLTPAGMNPEDVLDHAEIYPQVAALRPRP